MSITNHGSSFFWVLLLGAALALFLAWSAGPGAQRAEAQEDAASGTGLLGQYYNNKNLISPKLSRTDSTVNFSWGRGSPSRRVAPDTFSVRWRGLVEAPSTGTYTFYTQTDDGVRLWVNGRLLVDKWVAQGTKEWSGKVSLEAGKRYEVKMEYFENKNRAVARLLWSGPGLAKQVVPKSALYPPGSYPPDPTCSTSLQALVDAAASGSTVNVPGGCVYRETVHVSKPLTLKTESGAEIRGSDVWTNWQKNGSYWIEGPVPSFSVDPDMSVHGRCRTGTSGCLWPEQVFFDGTPLSQVASNPESGQFAVDSDRNVILADDPTGHTVEVTVRQFWVVARSSNVTIDGFTMKHATNSGQMGALTNAQFDNMTVQNNELSYAHGANVNLGMAKGLKLIGNKIHHGGQVGVLDYLGELTMQNNEIHDNNTEAFDPWWAAGGVKATDMIGLVADGNQLYNNAGPGLWCDQACESASISNNRIHHNESYGIHYEISQNAKIYGNTIWENGWGVPNSPGEPGILIASSHDVEVYDNTLAWNRDGIIVVNSDRGGTAYDQVSDVEVHHNNILAKDYADNEYHFALSWVKNYSGGNIYDPDANNQGHDNLYWFGSPEGLRVRYKWQLGPYVNLKTLSDFNQTLGEEGGRYLTQAEKDGVVQSSGVPESAEH